MGRLLAENERKNLAVPKPSALPLEDQRLDSEENRNQEPNDDSFKEAVGKILNFSSICNWTKYQLLFFSTYNPYDFNCTFKRNFGFKLLILGFTS